MCMYRCSCVESKNNKGKQIPQVHWVTRVWVVCVPPLQVNAKVCCKQTVDQG